MEYMEFFLNILKKLYFFTIVCALLLIFLLTYIFLLTTTGIIKVLEYVRNMFNRVKVRYFGLKLINPKTNSNTTSKFTELYEFKKYNEYNQYDDSDLDDDQFLYKTKFEKIEEEFGKGNISYQEYSSILSYLVREYNSKYNSDSDGFIKEHLTDMNKNYNESNVQDYDAKYEYDMYDSDYSYKEYLTTMNNNHNKCYIENYGGFEHCNSDDSENIGFSNDVEKPDFWSGVSLQDRKIIEQCIVYKKEKLSDKNWKENKKADIPSDKVIDVPKKKKKNKKKKKSNKSGVTVISDNVDLITETSVQTKNHNLFTNQSNSTIYRDKENNFNLTESLHEIERIEKNVNFHLFPNSKGQTSLTNVKKQHFESIQNNPRSSNEIKMNVGDVTGKKKKKKKKKSKSSAVTVISEKIDSSKNFSNNSSNLPPESYFNKSVDYDYEKYTTYDLPYQSGTETERKIKSNCNDFNLQTQYSRFDLEPRASTSYQSISENDSPIEESSTVAVFSDESRHRNYDPNISKSIVRRDDSSLTNLTHDVEEFDLEETIKKVKLVTEVTASVTNDVAKKFSSTLCAVGKSLTPHIQKHGSEFLSKNFGISEQEASEKVDGILDIVSQTVQSAGKFFEQKERPMSKVVEVLQAQSIHVENTENNLIKDAVSIVGNLMAISRNLSDISVKGVVKHASKNENNSL